MKSASMIGVGKYIGRGLVLVAVAILLTMLFSFLGTISCAALSGLMFGSNKQWRWYGSFLSVIFPAVMAAFLYFGKANFAPRQGILLSLICFGAFWVTFLMAVVAPYFEQQNESPAPKPTACSETSKPGQGSKKAVTSVPPDLVELQGAWSRTVSVGDQSLRRKVIEVTGNQLTLRILTSDGKTCFTCRSHVKPERLGQFKVLTFVDPKAESANSAEEEELPGTWVYRVTSETLAVASYLEDAADDRIPGIEIFERHDRAEA